jgi:hypothetical protein
LAADNLLGAEVVLADGWRVMTGPDEEPELFWAIRGGGNFGVVTSLRVQLHEKRHMIAGPIVYPLSEAEPVLRAGARPLRSRHRGRLIFGFYPLPNAPLEHALTCLRIVRGGGYPWTSKEVELRFRAN